MVDKYRMLLRFCVIAGIGCLSFLMTKNAVHLDRNDPPVPAGSGYSSSVVIKTYNSRKKQEEEKFDQIPRRVITVWQGPTETLLALGVGRHIIAAIGIPGDQYLNPAYREDYGKIPYTSFARLNQEAALAMHPDFIVTSWGSIFTEKSIGTTDFWQARGVNTYIEEIPPETGGKRTLDHECQFILDMGKIFHVSSKAEEIVNRIHNRIEEIEMKISPVSPKPAVMIVQFAGNRFMNWGDDYLQADIVTRLGGRILVHRKGYVNEEEILKQNPDVVFLMVNEWDYEVQDTVKRRFTDSPALNSLKCIHENRVYLLPLYEGQYSAVRTEEGVNRIAAGLYPDLFDKRTDTY